LASPPYVAVIECDPTARVTVQPASPEADTGWLAHPAIVVLPSANPTVPVGTSAPASAGVMCAV
jgi:hypothetical protein